MSEDFFVTLTEEEWRDAVDEGKRRHCQCVEGHFKNRYGAKDDEPGHIRGAVAECAAAKALNREWSGKDKIGGIDITGLQVRSCQWPDNPYMRMDDDDDPTHTFVLVTGRLGKDFPKHTYRIDGYLLGRDGMKGRYLNDWGYKNRPPCYYVPAELLHDARKLIL